MDDSIIGTRTAKHYVHDDGTSLLPNSQIITNLQNLSTRLAEYTNATGAKAWNYPQYGQPPPALIPDQTSWANGIQSAQQVRINSPTLSL